VKEMRIKEGKDFNVMNLIDKLISLNELDKRIEIELESIESLITTAVILNEFLNEIEFRKELLEMDLNIPEIILIFKDKEFNLNKMNEIAERMIYINI